MTEEVTYADLNVGDIIEVDGEQRVFLGLRENLNIGIHDNELHYYPENIYVSQDAKAAHLKEKAIRVRTTRSKAYKHGFMLGIKDRLVELFEEEDSRYDVIYDRIKVHNWSIDKALSVPVEKLDNN